MSDDDMKGMMRAPKAEKPEPVVEPGEFIFAAAFFDHGHINGQTNGLRDAGGVCKWAWDPDPKKLDQFLEKHPEVARASSFEQILEDPEVHLVTAAAVPSERSSIGIQVMQAGKDYYTDKSPFTTLEQLEEVRKVVADTKKKYFCDFSERLHTESAWHATDLINQGAIGRVLQVLILAPHTLNKNLRPDWFFDKEKYGGILTDIGSHQFEQFLAYGGARDATINYARVDNFENPDKPGLEDFGEASLTLSNGVSCYTRIDWFSADGVRAFGDGRVFVLGTEGSIEIRKYTDLATDPHEKQIIYLCDHKGEHRIPCKGRIGYPFYGQFVLDCLNRTEHAMDQDYVFKAAELSMLAQKFADESRSS
ncbi:MAG: Gfo/Idh/MocA family oxidoreductase [Opitutales bacterium]|nr:Gfo/Idh/MocA family oxidoreductase [Opitutales bacterium]